MTNYRRGYEIERKLKHRLEREGYYVIRSAGSHGAIDIFAMNSIEGLAIQVKRSKVNKVLYPKEMAEMKMLSFPPFVLKQLWVWLDKKRCWKIYRVL